MYLSYPPHVAKHFSKKVQNLIGYNVHKPNLGWVHGHDPIHLLTGEDFSHMGAEDFLTDQQTGLLTEFYAGKELAVTSHT